MKCMVVAHAVASRLEHGAGYAVIRCEVHNFPMEGLATTSAGSLCPIGRIERATEEALAKIERAQKLPGFGLR